MLRYQAIVSVSPLQHNINTDHTYTPCTNYILRYGVHVYALKTKIQVQCSIDFCFVLSLPDLECGDEVNLTTLQTIVNNGVNQSPLTPNSGGDVINHFSTPPITDDVNNEINQSPLTAVGGNVEINHFSLTSTHAGDENNQSLSTALVKDEVNPSSLSLTPIEPELMTTVRNCLKNKEGVDLCEEGVGGTYFIKDSDNNTVAIFKPTDEEPGALNNPKNLLNDPFLPPGGGAIREVAAYLLDRNLSGVPETHLQENLMHEHFSYADGIVVPKSGSIQRFVPNVGDSSCMNPALFSAEEVHNIGILDIRILNLDRNTENMLVKKDGDKFRLVPIDHTYSLPEILENIWFEWIPWKQAKVPFSQQTLEYIKNIDPEVDANILRDLKISESCIMNMKLATILLKKGAASDLNLYEIASIVCRKKPTEKSEMERLVSLARESNEVEKTFEREVEDYIQKKYPKSKVFVS